MFSGFLFIIKEKISFKNYSELFALRTFFLKRAVHCSFWNLFLRRKLKKISKLKFYLVTFKNYVVVSIINKNLGSFILIASYLIFLSCFTSFYYDLEHFCLKKNCNWSTWQTYKYFSLISLLSNKHFWWKNKSEFCNCTLFGIPNHRTLSVPTIPTRINIHRTIPTQINSQPINFHPNQFLTLIIIKLKKNR